LALINFGIDEYANPRLRTGRSRTKALRSRRPQAATMSSTGAAADAGAAEAGGTAPALGDQIAAGGNATEAGAEVEPQIRPATVSGRPIIEVRNLLVDYPSLDGTVRAVNDVSITLHRGELLGLAG